MYLLLTLLCQKVTTDIVKLFNQSIYNLFGEIWCAYWPNSQIHEWFGFFSLARFLKTDNCCPTTFCRYLQCLWCIAWTLYGWVMSFYDWNLCFTAVLVIVFNRYTDVFLLCVFDHILECDILWMYLLFLPYCVRKWHKKNCSINQSITCLVRYGVPIDPPPPLSQADNCCPTTFYGNLLCMSLSVSVVSWSYTGVWYFMNVFVVNLTVSESDYRHSKTVQSINL